MSVTSFLLIYKTKQPLGRHPVGTMSTCQNRHCTSLYRLYQCNGLCMLIVLGLGKRLEVISVVMKQAQPVPASIHKNSLNKASGCKRTHRSHQFMITLSFSFNLSMISRADFLALATQPMQVEEQKKKRMEEEKASKNEQELLELLKTSQDCFHHMCRSFCIQYHTTRGATKVTT